MSEQNKNDKAGLPEIMKCVGQILGKVDSIEKQNNRITLALIAVIAAQIGVKVLGSDPWLDVATAFSLIGVTLVLGGVATAVRNRKNGIKLTRLGWAFLTFLVIGTLTQIMVYIRELGFLSAQIIYIWRIFQNASLIVVGWILLTQHQMFEVKKKDDEDTCSGG